MFQFTHPGKGATVSPAVAHHLLGVSIHAPWEGCDKTFRGAKQPYREFQFTHPGKGATPALDIDLIGKHVSIHAPWEGCDIFWILWSQRWSRFNSRTLGRVRLLGYGFEITINPFQFTHPGKGATGLVPVGV